MEFFYPVSCAAAFVICAVLGWITRPKADDSVGNTEGFRNFQCKYLLAWAVCVCADWLQGPYVYALYEAYGFSRADNARLFVCGFGASFVFGTFVAGFADTIGRKRAVLLYCILYILSCMTKHLNQYSVLMAGRVTGGIATSILFSAFESWLVSEHTTRHNFPAKQLSFNFSMMWFVNYLVAVATGLVADRFVEVLPMHAVAGVNFGGLLMPFDFAIVCLIVGGVYVALVWEENYGKSEGVFEQVLNFGRGAKMICTNAKMGRCCVVVALFESSMYIFVFNWTPVLNQGTEPPPFGMIFSTFMMSCMIGASVFALLNHMRATAVLCGALVIGSGALFVPALIGMSDVLSRYNLWAFMLFELACGVYFPSICTLKSEAVPEEYRSTIYNLFRMPMNAIVITVLLINPDLVPTFKLIFIQLVLASVLVGVDVMMEPKAECIPLFEAPTKVRSN